MTLSDLGDLGDFIGGIGVIVTLVCLATQIRRNTQAVRAAELLGPGGALAILATRPEALDPRAHGAIEGAYAETLPGFTARLPVTGSASRGRRQP